MVLANFKKQAQMSSQSNRYKELIITNRLMNHVGYHSRS